MDLFYDGDGTRVKKVSGGSTTYYIGDNFEVAGGQEIKYIFAGNLRIAKVTSSGKHFYHKDHLGSSTVMTDVTGSVDETSEYLPFGLSRKHTGSEVTYYKFTDQELDSETGLYNYNARLYDPAAGIFVSPDSIVPDWYDPQSLNRYAYARNNPLKYIDPTGHLAGPGDHEAAAAAGKDFYGGYGDTWGNGPPSGNSDTGGDWAPSYMVQTETAIVELFGFKIGTRTTTKISIDGNTYSAFPGQMSIGNNSLVYDERGGLNRLSDGNLVGIEISYGEIPIGGFRFGKLGLKGFKKAIGKPYKTKPNRGGINQPYDAKTGQFKEYSANPGLIMSPAGRFATGFSSGWGAAAGAIGPTPVGFAGNLGYSIGNALGSLL